jgi:hypothetical protein
MDCYPIFLSVVVVVRNRSTELEAMLAAAARSIAPMVSDYEFVVVDNASDDDSVPVLRRLTGEDGLPNLQVYALTKEVDGDAATWAGLENALGDFVAVIDPYVDDLGFLPQMLDQILGGADAVFARNVQQPAQSRAYRVLSTVFNGLYWHLSGVNLAREAPRYRVLSKRIVTFIMQHAQPAVSYRHLPASGGFARANMEYSAPPRAANIKPFGASIELGVRLLVSTTQAPMRVVTSLSLFGAGANLLYSFYVVLVSLFNQDVEPGWISLSLQQSGMFFLISLVLLVLGEYVIQMVRLSHGGPLYHVGQEFTSMQMTRREKLNIEEVAASGVTGAEARSG